MQHELLLQLIDDKQKLQKQVDSLKLQLEIARGFERILGQRWSEERIQEVRQKQELSHLFQVNSCTVWICINIAFICCWGHCC